jgi:hypothetical protein
MLEVQSVTDFPVDSRVRMVPLGLVAPGSALPLSRPVNPEARRVLCGAHPIQDSSRSELVGCSCISSWEQ